MRILSATLLALALTANAQAAGAPDYQPLSGDWKGTVKLNSKDAKGGGNPTLGDTGTPVTIAFKPTANGLTGSSQVGSDPMEQWTIEGDHYTWKNADMAVTSERITCEQVPTWVRDEAKMAPGASCFAFKYKSCTLKSGTPCKVGTDLPAGIDKSGIWMFTVKGNEMTSDVFYTYETGGRRILRQQLTRNMPKH